MRGPSGTVGIGFGGELVPRPQPRLGRGVVGNWVLIHLSTFASIGQLKFYLRAAFPLIIEFWSSLLGLEFVGVFPAIVG